MTIQTTPVHLDDFIVGLLFTEGMIAGPAEIARLATDPDRGLVWVDLRPGAGAPGGAEGLAPLPPGITVSPPELAGWMGQMARGALLYQETRGIHSAMAVRPETGEWVMREDIGRHNAVDKVIGAALRRGWRGGELAVLTSGRISYEMCVKLARFGVGIAASRTAATNMACDLADRLGMDLVGYVRTATRYRLYTAGTRLRQA